MNRTIRLLRTHYETLEVPRDADIDAIKKAFRRLSKETHPDVAGSQADTERFKRISHAASVLTNPKKKEHYDLTLVRRRALPRPSAPRAPSLRANTPLQEILLTFSMPRYWILGTLVIMGVSYATREPSERESHMVKAWKNPETNRWEQPAPWDPVYQKLKPELFNVPRHMVRSRGVGK